MQSLTNKIPCLKTIFKILSFYLITLHKCHHIFQLTFFFFFFFVIRIEFHFLVFNYFWAKQLFWPKNAGKVADRFLWFFNMINKLYYYIESTKKTNVAINLRLGNFLIMIDWVKKPTNNNSKTFFAILCNKHNVLHVRLIFLFATKISSTSWYKYSFLVMFEFQLDVFSNAKCYPNW